MISGLEFFILQDCVFKASLWIAASASSKPLFEVIYNSWVLPLVVLELGFESFLFKSSSNASAAGAELDHRAHLEKGL